MRVDPAGFAARELVDRAEAHFPPAAKLVTVEGRPEALAEFVELARLPPPPRCSARSSSAPQPPAPTSSLPRLTLRAPATEGAALVRAAKDVAAIRSARKSEGALRIRVDPFALG